MSADLKQQEVYMADGATMQIAGILEHFSAHRVFLVADDPAYTASGAEEDLEPLFANRSVERFLGFEPNPRLEDIQRGIRQFRTSCPDIVIAVGGGTAIDLAKLIGTLAANQAAATDIITGRGSIEDDGPPLIAVPTTAGTGSEATHFAVAYVAGRKYSVASPRLLPGYAVIDSRFTHSLPAHITAASGLDAFCQSVESIWAVGATEDSIRYASESVRLANAYLPTCVQDPTPESRDAMCRAAHLSGKAINISKTTAAHAISYAVTKRYGTSHGMAVALTLGQLLRFNASVSDADCCDPRGAEHVRSRIATLLELLEEPSAERGASRIHSLMESVGAPTRLRDVGVKNKEAVAWIAAQVNVERLSNNPRKVDRADIERLLQNIR